jgi:hypothetical protein
MYNLNIPLGYHIWGIIRRVHAKYHEFRRYGGGDMNLSSFSFSEFCRLKEKELRRTSYMKDVVLYGMISTKFI